MPTGATVQLYLTLVYKCLWIKWQECGSRSTLTRRLTPTLHRSVHLAVMRPAPISAAARWLQSQEDCIRTEVSKSNSTFTTSRYREETTTTLRVVE